MDLNTPTGSATSASTSGEAPLTQQEREETLYRYHKTRMTEQEITDLCTELDTSRGNIYINRKSRLCKCGFWSLRRSTMSSHKNRGGCPAEKSEEEIKNKMLSAKPNVRLMQFAKKSNMTGLDSLMYDLTEKSLQNDFAAQEKKQKILKTIYVSDVIVDTNTANIQNSFQDDSSDEE